MKFVNPKNNVAFKKIFGDEQPIEQPEIAQRMLVDGMSPEMVTKYTQLPIEVVNTLLNQHSNDPTLSNLNVKFVK
jgi:hypothetical protein